MQLQPSWIDIFVLAFQLMSSRCPHFRRRNALLNHGRRLRLRSDRAFTLAAGRQDKVRGEARDATASLRRNTRSARHVAKELRSRRSGGDGPVVLKVVDAAEPPLRIFLGSGGLPMTRAEYAKRLETWEQLNPVSIETRA